MWLSLIWTQIRWSLPKRQREKLPPVSVSVLCSGSDQMKPLVFHSVGKMQQEYCIMYFPKATPSQPFGGSEWFMETLIAELCTCDPVWTGLNRESTLLPALSWCVQLCMIWYYNWRSMCSRAAHVHTEHDRVFCFQLSWARWALIGALFKRGMSLLIIFVLEQHVNDAEVVSKFTQVTAFKYSFKVLALVTVQMQMN